MSQVTLVRPVAVEKPDQKPLLVYLPGNITSPMLLGQGYLALKANSSAPAGTDGTGNSITPQLPGLVGAGFDIRCCSRVCTTLLPESENAIQQDMQGLSRPEI